MLNKVNIGTCIDCKEQAHAIGIKCPEKILGKKNPPLCIYHNTKRNKEKNAGPKKSKDLNRLVFKASDAPKYKPRIPKKQKFKRPTGEAKIFMEIWEERERVSFVTGRPLPDVNSARTFYFAHCLSKNKFPKFRLKKENIILLTLEEHTLFDFARYKIDVEDEPGWKKVFELEEKLKQEHNSLYGRK